MNEFIIEKKGEDNHLRAKFWVDVREVPKDNHAVCVSMMRLRLLGKKTGRKVQHQISAPTGSNSRKLLAPKEPQKQIKRPTKLDQQQTFWAGQVNGYSACASKYEASYFHFRYGQHSSNMSIRLKHTEETRGNIQASCYKRSTGGSPDNTFSCQIWKLWKVGFSFLDGGCFHVILPALDHAMNKGVDIWRSEHQGIVILSPERTKKEAKWTPKYLQHFY